ncbi:bcl-2-like protein 13 [Dunckerocampus dactyliophorus]|uniref:bcl-2-like protein 13 n=1 Tax=Dunckerocampus dactyliophorus TaxID=161453 RepID=UPI0024066CA6|nr:bcl-2-like protein 13 [Dunckerocampus dactyliophorus]XP_054609587.1 bcl-2-like protein 13 [Dunckerocampus dactyliophorus]
MGDVDPEDTKSLDSSDGAVLAGDENHSSNSDMVHLEREEAEMLEEAAGEEKGGRSEEEEEEEEEELQTSVLSVLGGESERQELLVPAEEAHTEKEPAGETMQVVPPMALPPLPIFRLEPPSTSSTPTAAEELPHAAPGLLPPSSTLPPAEPPAEGLELAHEKPLSEEGVHSVKRSAGPTTELPVLLCGGAALVAVVGVMAYGAVAYCRK